LRSLEIDEELIAKLLKEADADSIDLSKMYPEEIKGELDKWIIGQDEAKTAIAVAMRNRFRRSALPPDIRKEIIPKNILMVGPSGCGKTEIARRLASLASAPFIKVEATKYTEVGYRGADVDSIIKGLADNGIKIVKERLNKNLQKHFSEYNNELMIDEILGVDADAAEREDLQAQINNGVEYVFVKNQNSEWAGQMVNFEDIKKELMRESQLGAQDSLIAESNPLIVQTGIKECEEFGIVYIDEIDKIVTGSLYSHHHSDASDEGVQRDLLPLIEGTKVKTEHGEIDTSKILFIASGAFLQSKPSDMLAELQGRLPIRVQCKSLSEEELYRVLTEPEAPLILKEKAMLKTEGVDLRFTDEAIRLIAKISYDVNNSVENIGARRLHTVLERIVEEVSYDVEDYRGKTFVIDEEYVHYRMKEFQQKVELKKYIL